MQASWPVQLDSTDIRAVNGYVLASTVTKIRTIVAGVDTPNDHGPATILAALGLASLAQHHRPGFAAGGLARPSFPPEVGLTCDQFGNPAMPSLAAPQTNIGYRRCYEMQVANGKRAPDDHPPREPERWEETRLVPPDRFAHFA